MIVGPIGTYFLTLNTIFRGLFRDDSSSFTTHMLLSIGYRQFNICWRNCCVDGQCRLDRLCRCCYERGRGRKEGSGGQGEESGVMAVSNFHHIHTQYSFMASFLLATSFDVPPLTVFFWRSNSVCRMLNS